MLVPSLSNGDGDDCEDRSAIMAVRDGGFSPSRCMNVPAAQLKREGEGRREEKKESDEDEEKTAEDGTENETVEEAEGAGKKGKAEATAV